MIFITGANGLLGSFVARTLLSKGIKDVTGLKRSASDMSAVADIRDSVRWLEGDILDQLFLERHIGAGDTVVHCAAMVSFNKEDEARLYRVNVEGTKNVANACLKNNAAKLIYISSIATYGAQYGNGSVTEVEKKSLSLLKSNYGVSKYLAELEVWRANIEGLNTVILNPSVILGPAGWDNSSVRLFKYIWRENLFTVKGALNCVDVRDVAEIVYRLIQKDANGQQFIVSAERIAYTDLFEKIAKGFNKRPPRFEIPGAALYLAYFADLLRALITGKKAAITSEIKKAVKGAPSFNSGKVRYELDFNFRSIDDTITWTCRELKKMSLQHQ